MGSEQSGMRSEEEFLREFEEIRRESDVHFGSVTIYRNIKNPKLTVMVKERLFVSEEDLKQFISRCRARMQLKGVNIAPLIEIIVHQDKKLCSTAYRCMIGYEFHERTLEKLLRQRKTYESEDAQNLSEEDAWGVLSDLTRALICYKERGLSHGDVQPASVFVLNDKTLKLVDTCFMNEQESAFHRRYQDFMYKSPLSPQAMTALSLGPNYATFEKEKNDIWSMGMTVLVSLTNEDFNIFYDWTNQDINFELLQSRIKKVHSLGYSSEFIKLLRSLLEKDEFKRPSLHDINQQVLRSSHGQRVSMRREPEVDVLQYNTRQNTQHYAQQGMYQDNGHMNMHLENEDLYSHNSNNQAGMHMNYMSAQQQQAYYPTFPSPSAYNQNSYHQSPHMQMRQSPLMTYQDNRPQETMASPVYASSPHLKMPMMSGFNRMGRRDASPQSKENAHSGYQQYAPQLNSRKMNSAVSYC